MHWTKNCQLLFGTYCEVHDEPELSHTMTPQTHADIEVGRTRNLQGSQKFCSLNTRKILKHRSFTDMPIPYRVIIQVNAAGIKEKLEQYCTYLT